jgi:signal transduction histidine kinase
MNQVGRPRGYHGGYLIGFIMIGAAAVRAILFYQGQSNLGIVKLFIAIYALLYALEPWLSNQFRGHVLLYFPLQTVLVVALSTVQPFSDFHTVLYFPLCIQVFRAFSRSAAIRWTVIFVSLCGITLILGLGLFAGLAFILLYLAVGAFLISYDFLYLQTQADQAESQRLLADLKSAHEKLQEYATQAEELAAARERNRLARELHDSVSQVIFSITLTSQSGRLLLERDPTRVPEQIERLQEMTSSALAQLRSLIAELRPPYPSCK